MPTTHLVDLRLQRNAIGACRLSESTRAHDRGPNSVFAQVLQGRGYSRVRHGQDGEVDLPADISHIRHDGPTLHLPAERLKPTTSPENPFRFDMSA